MFFRLFGLLLVGIALAGALLECADPAGQFADQSVCESFRSSPRGIDLHAKVLDWENRLPQTSGGTGETSASSAHAGVSTGGADDPPVATGDDAVEPSVELSKGTTLSGRANVIDGDGLTLGDNKIRLFGIDAPEVDQSCEKPDGSSWPCGHYSSVALDRAAGGKPVECTVQTKDHYGRYVAVCSLDGTDLSALQVREGWALAYRRYSDSYISDEDRAKSRKAGIWRGPFEPPWDWRNRKRRGK